MAELTQEPRTSESQLGSLLLIRPQTAKSVGPLLCSEAETSKDSWAAEALPQRWVARDSRQERPSQGQAILMTETFSSSPLLPGSLEVLPKG